MVDLIGLERSVIPALDFRGLAHLEKVVKACSSFDKVRAYKVGFAMGLRYTLGDVVATIKNTHPGAKVIYDHQKASTDIPDVAQEFASTLKDSGVDSAIIFPQSGPISQLAFTKALQEAGLDVICGGEMTHKGYLAKDGGYLCDNAPDRMYGLAVQLGVKSFVVPGNKPERIEYYLEFIRSFGLAEPVLYSPGLITQKGDISKSGHAAGKYWHAICGRAVFNPLDKKNLEDVTESEISESLTKLVSQL